MKVLVIGGGGREHSLVWKIAQSPKVEKLFCAPGNAGIAAHATCVPIKVNDGKALLDFVREESIDLTVVGPEKPLADGLVDLFEADGRQVFGPRQAAAELETSKTFAKHIMTKYGIPTAHGASFSVYEEALAYIRELKRPVVVKADGLAEGKGVIVCDTEKAAAEALKAIMKEKRFGDAGATVLIEEKLMGEEVSFLVFTDGQNILPLPTSQDHKAAFDGDEGPNTGGMGAYSPAPLVDKYLHRRIMETVMTPAIKGMAAEGRPYQGVLYAGLMIDKDTINVLEFNARFGDPETQPLMMRLKSDLVPVMEACSKGNLVDCTLEIDDRAAVCVVMAAGGYPGTYKKGLPITGLKNVHRMKDIKAFQAGTKLKDKRVITDGGRVLGITALGKTIEKAISRAYAGVTKISWEGAFYRTDIGAKAVSKVKRKPRVAIVMGSDSDLPTMEATAGVLKKFNIPYELSIVSAHRTPEKAAELATTARKRGLKVIIAGAGLSAHLAGVLAAHTTLPVIGVPLDASSLNGFEALLSTVQMPPGVPVATVAIGKVGAKNAGYLAIQILATSDKELSDRYKFFKNEMKADVERKNKQLQEMH